MKFWNWIKNEETGENELILNGPISDETWWGDEVTPALFKNELKKHTGDVTVWINSPGGDVFAASQIYTMLRNHKGKITVKIDGIAASAASVVAMAGDETLISPTGYIMIHNPATIACGSKADMQKAIDLLDEIKEGIINAYEDKTGLSRSKLSHFMDDETWFNARKAVELGFVDGILFSGQHSAETESDEKDNENSKSDESNEGKGDQRENDPERPNKEEEEKKAETESLKRITPAFSFSSIKISASIAEKIQTDQMVPIAQLEKRLELLK